MRGVGVVLVVALATLLHAAGWFLMHERVSPPNVVGQLASVSFSPIAAGNDGEVDTTTEDQIRSDLAVIAPYTRTIRTYSVSKGLDLVPELASEFGLHVTLGAWIDDWDEQNEREIQTAIELAKHHDAVPDPVAQAQIIRDFVTRADAMGIDYSIVEAFDQPWKTFEGSVGAYWGMFDNDRQPKFVLTGAVETPNWVLKTVAALAIGLLLCIPIFASPGITPLQAGVFAGTAHAIGAWGSNVFDYWATHYFVLGSLIAMIVGAMLLVPLIAIMKQRLDELAEIIFGGSPKRLLTPGLIVPDRRPLVSIHIPAYREPPEMLRQTLDSVAKLDWLNLECIVVINNTPEASYWRPIEEHCELLGPRFKFLRADQLAGFKAGALRLAMEHTAPEAEIIGVLDADYVVHPDWLKDLVPAFATPNVGLVQAPQDHRDGDRSVVHAVMNREYAGFFDIGMVQRNEVNAIVSHGTMCLVRRSALVDAG